VSKLLLPHLEDRPVALLRAPAGVGGQMFFQKHAEARALPHVEQLPRSLDPGNGALLAIGNQQGLLSAAQMNMVELHTWNATRHAIEKPDRVIFDLDPGNGVAWKQVVEAAVLVKALLDELELKSFLKTSGGKGLHVVLPLKPALGWDEVKQFSGDIVRHLARVIPQRFVAKSGPTNRVGRIFVDYLRNGRGATTVSAWSARARPGMGISVPLGWDELPSLSSASQWSVANTGDRLAIGNTPWRAYERSRQSLTRAVGALKSMGSGKR
jgi:bifunctional non-homologous end joining protein LigD